MEGNKGVRRGGQAMMEFESEFIQTGYTCVKQLEKGKLMDSRKTHIHPKNSHHQNVYLFMCRLKFCLLFICVCFMCVYAALSIKLFIILVKSWKMSETN